jgi:hypothetical protein
MPSVGVIKHDFEAAGWLVTITPASDVDDDTVFHIRFLATFAPYDTSNRWTVSEALGAARGYYCRQLKDRTFTNINHQGGSPDEVLRCVLDRPDEAIQILQAWKPVQESILNYFQRGIPKSTTLWDFIHAAVKKTGAK